MDLVISLYAILIPALKLSFFRESYTIKSEWGLVSMPLSYFKKIFFDLPDGYYIEKKEKVRRYLVLRDHR